MGNLTKIHKMPEWCKTPLLSVSLDSHDLRKHRAMIGMELEILSKKVDRFGWDRDHDTPVQDRIIRDWMDALQDYGLAEVQRACKQAIEENPSKCPNEGHVKRIVIRNRGKDMQALPKPTPVEPKANRVTAEAAANILEMAGFKPKSFGGTNV